MLDDYSLFGGDGPGFFSRDIDQTVVDRTWQYCCSLARREVDDPKAVAGILAAAGGDRRIVEGVAQSLNHGEGIANDPLLAHIAAVATAASTGATAPPLTGVQAETAVLERRLIDLPLGEAFGVLAERQPALHDVLRTVTAPGWVEQHRRQLTRTERLLGWVEDRLSLPQDLKAELYGDRKPSEVAAAQDQAEPAVREVMLLLRPVFSAHRHDPIFRTRVAVLVCRLHLITISGAIPAWARSWDA